MKNVNLNKSDIFKMAWAMAKGLKSNFADALRKAWAYARRIVSFSYRKVNSDEIRDAKGCIDGAYTSKAGHAIVTYFDIEAMGFRSFRLENVVQLW